jgi:multidrug efflux system outer membrane protein
MAPIPGTWPSGPAYKQAVSSKATVVVADIKWEDFIVSEPLRTIVHMALANNRDLKIAALDIERARALYHVQRAELLPVVDATASGGKEQIPGILSPTGQPTTTEIYNVNLGISSWELDFFGRIRSLKDQALELYLATEQARRSTQVALIAEIMSAYLTLAADRENLKLAQSTLETQQATYEMIKRRFEVGVSSELDLQQAKTRMEAARVDIAKYTAQTALDENALNLLVGSMVPAELLPDELTEITTLHMNIAGIPSDMLLRRPDILQAEHQLKAANANIGAARAAFFPSITLTTSIGTTSDQLSGLFKAGSGGWNFLPQVTIPIFDTRVWSAYDVVKAERDISLVQYEKTIQTAFREVADALAQRGTLDDQMAAQQSLVSASAESYRLSDARYTKGIDSYLSVLDAQRSLYGAQQGLIAVRLTRLVNLITLYKVLGGGA